MARSGARRKVQCHFGWRLRAGSSVRAHDSGMSSRPCNQMMPASAGWVRLEKKRSGASSGALHACDAAAAAARCGRGASSSAWRLRDMCRALGVLSFRLRAAD
eukprot:4462283-Prymnesium_polylepis.3